MGYDKDRGLLHDLLTQGAIDYNSRTAVSNASGKRTHGELWERSFTAARALVTNGVKLGDRVLLVLSDALIAPELIFGVSLAGGVFVIQDAATPKERLKYVVHDADPRLIVTDVLAARDIGALLRVDTVSPVDLAGSADDVLLPIVHPSDTICLVYTSGSTADPKAVISTHEQVRFSVAAIQSVLKYRQDDVIFNVLPLTFDYGLYQVFLAALAGSHLILANERSSGSSLLWNLRTSGTTVLPAVPALLSNLLRMLSRKPKGFERLRLITNTGGDLPPNVACSLRDLLPRLTIHAMYGLTECKRATIMPAEFDVTKAGSCGLPLPGTEVFVVNNEGDPVAPGIEGQICVSGPNVMSGYWHQPALTKTRFKTRADGTRILLTGDYGWIDDSGYLYFIGRRDDIYKQRGFRVSSTEVESAASSIAGVALAVVVPPSTGERADLLVEGSVQPRDVLNSLSTLLEEAKLPGRCIWVDTIPTTANGKVDRRWAAGLSRQIEDGGEHVEVL